MTSRVCVLGRGWGCLESRQKRTTFFRDSPQAFTLLVIGGSPPQPTHFSRRAPAPAFPGAASGCATHETMCTRHFPPRGPPPPARGPGVSPGSHMQRVARLHSGALICGESDGNEAEERLPRREAGSHRGRHMLPPGQLPPGWSARRGDCRGSCRPPGSPGPTWVASHLSEEGAATREAGGCGDSGSGGSSGGSDGGRQWRSEGQTH